MLLAKHIKVIRNESGHIICNTINQSIIQVHDNQLENRCILEGRFLEQELTLLKKLGFFEHSMNDYIDFKATNVRDQTTITINITEDCNHSCSYCYQNDFTCKNSINEKTIELILSYIEALIGINQKNFYIYFFGGEPLLYKEKIIYIKDLIDCLITQSDAYIHYGIGTNGYLLNDSFLEKFDSLTIDTTLTLQNDHDTYRSLSNGRGTFKSLVNTFKSISTNHKQVELNIGYNVNHENIDDFDSFLRMLRKEKITAHVTTSYVDNYAFNPHYKNLLTKQDYLKWASSTAIKTLIANNFHISATPFFPYEFTCDGYEKWSIKFFSDASIGLCNATNFHNRIPIDPEIYFKSPLTIQHHLSNFKNSYSKENETCLSCQIMPICRGKIYCDFGKCNPENELLFDEFIKTYVNEVENGNAHYFTHLA